MQKIYINDLDFLYRIIQINKNDLVSNKAAEKTLVYHELLGVSQWQISNLLEQRTE